MDPLMEKLSNAFGPTGFEGEVSKIMEAELKKRCPKVTYDRMGDVIGHMGSEKTEIMLGAHMDEIGLMVKSINEKGFIRFIKVGGIDDRVLPNQRVKIQIEGGKFLDGVIGTKPPAHAQGGGHEEAH